MSRWSSALAAVWLLVACGDSEDDTPQPEPTYLEATGITQTCSTGISWVGGVEGSPRMLPGANCINCHQGGIQPNFDVAGTVHAALGDQDGCAGVEGVKVELTDAAEQTFTFITNASGNFSGAAPGIQVPYRATISHEGRTRPMNFEVVDLDCNRCHAQVGINGAPGRILAP